MMKEQRSQHYNGMNINFIRNLSDEILRENQQLKTDIITLKQHLADYQDQMTAAIAEVAKPTLLTDPRQILTAFIDSVRQFIAAKAQVENTLRERTSECKSLRLQRETLKDQCACLESQLSLQREKGVQAREEGKQAERKRQREREEGRLASEQLSRELIQLKEQLRLERLMMLESKRREVEEVRQYHLKELLQFREKADREVVQVQRQMQTQLAEKDSTIRDLEKALQKLSHNLKLDGRESDILVKLLSSFQEYNHLSSIIKQRTQQLSRFRQQVQELDLARIKAESKLKEATTSEANLHGQAERLNLEKRQLEEKLLAQKQILEKSEQDKDAMERYYDLKWNKEYNKVKTQLEKSFAEKIAAVEKQCTQKIQDMHSVIEETQQKLTLTLSSNQSLEEAIKQKQQEVAELRELTEGQEKLILELRREQREQQAMFKQELEQRSIAHSAAITSFQSQIGSLNSLLSVEKQIYDDLQNKHQQQLQAAAEQHRLQLAKQLAEKDRQRKILEHTHEKQLLAVHRELENKERIIQDAKNVLSKEIEEQFQRRAQAAQREVEARSRQKEEQLSRRNDKWMVKFKEVDLKYTHLKKRQEDEQQLYKKEISRLETENQALKKSQGKLHAQVKEALVIKNQLIIRIGDLEKRIAVLNLQLQKSAEDKASLQEAIECKKQQISSLKQARHIWLGEITQLQKAYKLEFDALKSINNRQIDLLKSKVWELEELVRKRPIKRRDFERLQQLDRERKQLRNEVHLKEAQNIILNQVKDYYETKLREEEKPSAEQVRAGTALTGYKLRMLKRSANKQSYTYNEFEDSKEMTEMRKYIVKSTKRSMKLSLSKIRCEDIGRYHRLNTAYE